MAIKLVEGLDTAEFDATLVAATATASLVGSVGHDGVDLTAHNHVDTAAKVEFTIAVTDGGVVVRFFLVVRVDEGILLLEVVSLVILEREEETKN